MDDDEIIDLLDSQPICQEKSMKIGFFNNTLIKIKDSVVENAS